MQKLEKILSDAQANVVGSMLKSLADDLGVAEEALDKLGIGWLPIVKFKSGKKSYQGWWAIPEYDARGNLIGISLRSQSGDKCFFNQIKGNRGLAFSVNQEHRHRVKYRPGAHNWVRTHEQGIDCPVCGKPDGCLLSKDDPEDPSAVICRVVEEGSVKNQGLGWLHVLKKDSKINKNATLIAESEHPVIVVEGMTDAAAAISMGFEAVGRPSDRSGLAMLGKMLNGRDVIVVGENDVKADGRAPGFEGMKATATALQSHCSSVKKVMPPKSYKDLRTWYREVQLTADEFLAYVEERGDGSVENPVLADDNPTTAAREFIKERFVSGADKTLVSWLNSEFHVYQDGRYRAVKPHVIDNEVRKWSFGRHYLSQKPGSSDPILMPVRQTKSWIGNVLAAIPCEASIGMFEEDISPPMWLPGHSGPDPKLLVPFRNGLLDVEAWCNGDEEYLLQHTPGFFNLTCLPYDFDPHAIDQYWLDFLHSAIGDDPKKIRVVQEWYGYCLTRLTHHQKFLILVGAKNSGKSVILNTLQAMVGEENFGAGDFHILGDKFGFADQLGKLVTGFDEAKITKSLDTNRVAQYLKQLSGGAPVAVEKKGKDSKTARLHSRMMMTCNTMPYIRDGEDALLRRLLIVRFLKTAKNIDTTLEEKMRTQLPFIALWALKGFRRLQKQGKFTTPDSMAYELKEWSDATNPVASFMQSCCEVGPLTHQIDENQLYAAYLGYMEARHRHRETMSIMRFSDNVRSNSDGTIVLDATVRPHHRNPTRFLKGIKLQQWAEQTLVVGD